MGSRMITVMVERLEREGSPLRARSPFWKELLETAARHHHLSPELSRVELDDRVDVLAVPTSGGLDSTVAYWMASERTPLVRPFYVGLGTPYRDHEERALKDLGIHPEVLESGVDHDTGALGPIVPARNLWIVLMIAERLQREGLSSEIWLGAFEGEISLAGGDESIEFRGLLNQHLEKLWWPSRMVYPFETMTKRDVAAWAIEHGRGDELLLTRTCLRKGARHCGRCTQCAGRFAALVGTPLEGRHDWEGLGPWDDAVRAKAAFVRRFLKTGDDEGRMMSRRWAEHLQVAFRALGIEEAR